MSLLPRHPDRLDAPAAALEHLSTPRPRAATFGFGLWLVLVNAADLLRQVGNETFEEMDLLDGDAQVSACSPFPSAPEACMEQARVRLAAVLAGKKQETRC